MDTIGQELNYDEKTFEFTREHTAEKSTAAPAFGKVGGATQYHLDDGVGYLEEYGYIERI